MRRHGGAARIRRLESGTEIELTLPPLSGAGEAAAAPAPAGEAPEGGEPSETAPTESAAESRQAQPTGGRTA
jgi:hypothetical protein